ncbi:MAG: hypothetical protein J6J12_06020 [Oscillospiraceae bacterium]|nr:hypothetical protein [Oscillospiraceae bacterium]
MAGESKGDGVPLQILFLVRGQTIKGLSDCIGVNLVPEDFKHIIIFFAGKLFQYIPFFLLVIQEDCLLPAVQAVGFPEKSVCRFSSALEFLHEGLHRIFQIVLHPWGGADFLVSSQRRQRPAFLSHLIIPNGIENKVVGVGQKNRILTRFILRQKMKQPTLHIA